VKILSPYLALLFLACAHHSASDPLVLKQAAETFHERVRWRDYRAAEQLIIPDRRGAFDAARAKHDDEHNLSISDYELQDARFAPDGKRAWVASRISWTRLPSVSEQSTRVDSEFIWQNGSWMLARQIGGPFAEELGPEYSLRTKDQ
jgi:hypothetical protein